MKTNKITLLTAALCLVLPLGQVRAQTTLSDLRVQHATEPLAVEDAHPSFSWKMVSSAPGQKQQAYRIRVRRGSDKRLRLGPDRHGCGRETARSPFPFRHRPDGPPALRVEGCRLDR